MARLVLIDDTNPSIQYSGPWFEVNNTQIDTGFNGPPFQNTLHGVNVSANFSFSFSGSRVLVYGTSITTNASGTQDPTWECFIDNTSIGWSQDALSTEADGNQNNWILCGGQFQDGVHLLTVKANVSNQQTFWFDQIQYAPSASVSLNQSLLRIDSRDSAIQYSSEWEFIDGSITYDYDQSIGGNNSFTYVEAKFTYQFSGTSISMFGSLAWTPSTYAIDDQTPITFPVPTSADTTSNLILFETAQLSPGQHKLVVAYSGISTSPLIFNYFVQQEFSTSSNTLTYTPPSSTSVPSGSSSNSSPSSSTTIQRKQPTGAIIGGVIGGLVLISFLLALFFNRRRNNRRSQALTEMSYSVPFTGPSSNPTSTFLSQNYTSNGQSLLSQSISSKFTQRSQPSGPSGTSSSGGISPLTPLQPQFSSPIRVSPSSSLPLTGSQINLDSTRTGVPQAATEPSMQRSPSPQGANVRFLRHEDSGVRIPAAEDDVVELPPLYTPG